MNTTKEERQKFCEDNGLVSYWLEDYIASIPQNNIQQTENFEVLLYCYLEFRNNDEFWLPSQYYRSWRKLGFRKAEAKQIAKHYRESGWVGNQQNSLYFARSCLGVDSVPYYLSSKYPGQRLEEIPNLFFSHVHDNNNSQI